MSLAVLLGYDQDDAVLPAFVFLDFFHRAVLDDGDAFDPHRVQGFEILFRDLLSVDDEDGIDLLVRGADPDLVRGLRQIGAFYLLLQPVSLLLPHSLCISSYFAFPAGFFFFPAYFSFMAA